MELSLIYSFLIALMIYGGSITLLLTIILIYFSNPFKRLTIVKSLFLSTLDEEEEDIVIEVRGEMIVETAWYWRVFAWVKNGSHILKNAWFNAPRIPGSTWEEIAENLHELRFNPRYPFIIAGDHFSVFYPRNLGIFYYPILDPRIGFDSVDFLNREKYFSQSVAYAIEAFSKADRLSTTITPVSSRRVVLINVYAYPSDSMYGVLMGLKLMQSPDVYYDLYPFESRRSFRHRTAQASETLLNLYKTKLVQLYDRYIGTVYDEKTGFIKQDIAVSSMLDSKIRESAFYDNVILWKTAQLAGEFGIADVDQNWLDDYKKRILERYWDDEAGIFLEDNSDASHRDHRFASDWAIVLMTGFLHPRNLKERRYFERSVEHIWKHKLDEPFPLKMTGSPTKQKDHPLVRYCMPNYHDNTIWSNWGVQHIKVLTLLYAETNDERYLHKAEAAVSAYQENMVRFGGYPEVYDETGDMLHNPIYRSMLRIGWVIDFEHAVAMFEYYRKNNK